MKKIFLISTALFSMFAGSAFAHDVYVSGYTRSNGTYVQPYVRSAPDNTVYNNWSYRGNMNPYTGSVGTNSYIYKTR